MGRQRTSKAIQWIFATCLLAVFVTSVDLQAASHAPLAPLSCGQAATVDRSYFLRLISRVETSLADADRPPLQGHGTTPELWTWDGPEGARHEYEFEFEDLFKAIGNSQRSYYFETLLAKWRAQGLSTNVLDVFGGGFFIEDRSQVSSLMGLRWGPIWAEKLSAIIDRARIPKEILGDALNSKTWIQADLERLRQGQRFVDLITMRPYGGWSPMNKSAVLTTLGIQHAVANAVLRLSPHGHMYFSVPVEHLSGDLSQRSSLQNLIKDVEMRTPYKLILIAKMNSANTTYGLLGAIVPK